MDAYDISRDIFNPQKHYTGVRMQQGRVLTDDDWNEEERIEDEDKRRGRIDIIGPYGSPDNGYKIEGLTLNNDGTFDFTIDPGILYLGGLRLHHGKETYQYQYDWLEQPAADYTTPTANDLANGSRTDLVYLEVWEQGVSAVEDGELFEPALGGPDTTTRVRNMARVRIATGIGQSACADAWTQLQQNWTANHLGTIDGDYQRVTDVTLKVSFPGTGLPQDLCTPQVAGGYLGAENQAIRVQLRKNNTFTWGFDDGAPLYRVNVNVINGVTTITMVTLPKDTYHWPLSGQVVEFLPWSALLPDGEKVAGQEGYIDKVANSYDPKAKTFTISGALPANFGTNWQNKPNYQPPVQPAGPPPPTPFYYLRVWNRGTDTSSDAEISFTPAANPASKTLGNTGLSIQLYGSVFLPGDYWVIAARPETPAQVWPWALQLLNGIAPMGVRRFFAPLAMLQWSLTNGVVTGTIISDCRIPFKPLTDQDCCCTYTVGDGVTSHGDYDKIQDAVDAMPANGGKICILPGIHRDTVTITGKRNIEICGCGAEGIILPGIKDQKLAGAAVISIVSSRNIRLCGLTVINMQGSAVAIYISTANPGPVDHIQIEGCQLLAARYVVYSSMGDNNTAGYGNIRIANNRMGQYDIGGTVPAIFTLGDDVIIECNRIVVIPAPANRNPNMSGGSNDPGSGVYTPCFDPTVIYKTTVNLQSTVAVSTDYVSKASLETAVTGTYTAQGGIQIGSTSERVNILRNMILGGSGLGIAFGHVLTGQVDNNGQLPVTGAYAMYEDYNAEFTQTVAQNDFNGSLYDVLIAENHILLMGLSGIGVSAFFSLDKIGLLFRVEGLGIYRNVIRRCAQQIQTLYEYALKNVMDQTIAFGGIVLAAAENPIIRDNLITENGLNSVLPVCGIYIEYGEKVEITHNRVLNNGIFQKSNEFRRGNRAGIAVFAVQLLDAQNAYESDTPAFEGVPAANIAANEVDQPVGLALYLVASGQVSILENRFTSRVIDTSSPIYQEASTIYVLDLGVSKDLLAWIITALGSFEQLGAAMPAQGTSGAASTTLTPQETYQYLPGGRVMFANNQVSYLISTANKGGKIIWSAQLIASLDDIAYMDNQNEINGYWMKGLPKSDITFADTALFGITVRSNNNRWQDGLSAVGLSLFSAAVANTCAFNQSSYWLLAFAPAANLWAYSGNILV
jgi:hypothetical protein